MFLGVEIGKKLSPDETISVESSASSGSMPRAQTPAATPKTPNFTQKSMGSSSSEGVDTDFRPENVCPINALTPFYNSWTIRAFVMNKGQLRTYSNQKGSGKVFNFDVSDHSDEIRITCFNDECDRFYDLIEKDKVYYIGRGMVKPAQKKFSNLKNDYEITLTSNSFIKICNDVQMDAPVKRYKFINLETIANLETNTTIDVIAVIRSVGEIEQLINKKNGKELLKRELFIVDKSMTEARLTLWGEQAQNFQGEEKQVIAVKGVSVGEFRGKTLSAQFNSLIDIEPDLAETHLLHTWYMTLDDNATFNALSKGLDQNGIVNNTKYIADVDARNIQHGETLNFNCTATVETFNRISNHLYKSCGFNNCPKKVIDENNGLYHCTKCERTSPTFTWRIMINFLLNDISGSFWVTCFQENLEKILNKTVVELAQIYETDQQSYANLINDLRFRQFQFRIYTRLDTYNNEIRLRHTVSQVNPIKSVEFAPRLMQLIDQFENN